MYNVCNFVLGPTRDIHVSYINIEVIMWSNSGEF